MRVLRQTVGELVTALSPLPVDWMDEQAADAIAALTALPPKDAYARADVAALLDADFQTGLLCCRLFLALSKDQCEAALRAALGPGGIGVTRYVRDGENFLAALEGLGLLDAMSVAVNHRAVWSDVLVERLRSGRGSAISGQKRGLGLENVVEAVVREVFGEGGYEMRVTFTGVSGRIAKCDVAIPDKGEPRILIESKAYGATGSKMSDVIGDLDHIIEAKRRDAALLVVTDGITWKARQSDMARIVERQNDGRITRVYTTEMRGQFLDDLRTLKTEFGL